MWYIQIFTFCGENFKWPTPYYYWEMKENANIFYLPSKQFSMSGVIEAEWRICVSKLTITGSYNGLSPDRRQTIIWTNAGILSIGPLGTNLSEILIAIHIFSFNKMHLKMSSGKWRPCCLGLNVLMGAQSDITAVTATFLHLPFFCICTKVTHWLLLDVVGILIVM